MLNLVSLGDIVSSHDYKKFNAVILYEFFLFLNEPL